MDCLALAQKLAAKNQQKQATLTPISNKRVTRPVIAHSENADDNSLPKNGDKKAHFGTIAPTHYVPPISTVFTDVNLNRYFKRFLAQGKCESVIDFIESTYEYKKNFPSAPEKQVKAHRSVVEKLGTLPSQFIKAATSGSGEMTSVSANSFDKCDEYLLAGLNEREYESFTESELFSKWILKYHNVDLAQTPQC